MTDRPDYIKATNNNIQGQIALNKITNEKGIVIGEFNENNAGWKVQISLDNESIIQLLNPNDYTLLGYCDNQIFLDRLIRDINSQDLKTRQWTTETLCYYIETTGSDIELQLLSNSINKMINRLAIETDYDVQQKLSEGIFEYIWLEMLNKEEEQDLIIKLAKMDKDTLFCYLDDEAYLQFDEVKQFIKRGRK
jgi:hypothetical protein